ncbi:NACHT domain-containing protein [Lentzea flaviverrucosa]|uniref:NACHT domain-containing protein n=1 Tax=Lentzea flaviverrucosa TaxID=200379 RepID=A0A1H9JZK4_9PSEU|nr:hypothetical protein [Lentzea flaviverrucosa]RDI26695.1 hypothetical protein DFR72_107336 [Lentzea flaviverrucosa]SEQ92416.1 hypothetical protein SAMN05216195_103429 [Lentzea flaviverrucosa]
MARYGAEVPRESGFEVVQGRYLYERLGEKPFQQLCGALLARDFPDVTCMPVGQSDGGRDIVRPAPGGGFIVYQVKWSSKTERRIVAWLKAALDGEADNIRRLAAEGATEYFLITSVAGTSVPGRGTMDRVAAFLRERSAEYGISMRCLWRADLDARLDTAPQELLWSYADMLAGWQLIRYLRESSELREREAWLRDVVTKVVATQWVEDSKVKFKQVDLDSCALVDLFVDVEAERVVSPRAADRVNLPLPGADELGGAARHLLTTIRPFTLVLGAPGQGKSTLTQYLCQLHRAAFLSSADKAAGEFTVEHPRFPLRVDLRDYASWLQGHDPFDHSPLKAVPKKSDGNARSLESFLAHLLQVKSGDMPVSVRDAHDLITRFPPLLVLDGLDEVALAEVRKDVVTHIDQLTARLTAAECSPQVIVTARPNSSGLAEPSADRFDTITLSPLSTQLRSEFLEKWAEARRLPPGDRATLERIFEERSGEPHIAQLAQNPMQLTILLYLIQKRGESIPQTRTELYRSYMETFLDREAAKTSAVQKHRDDLEEVTAFLGWHFQALAELDGADSQLSVKEIKKAVLGYLYEAQKSTHLVDELFTAVTDRVWALTSKEQDSFRFDVQPVQEYFAASYLFHVAGAEQRGFNGSDVFRALVRRPYWFNTCRFYAGFASVNDLAALAEVLEEEIERSSAPFDLASPDVLIEHTRLVVWTLLADGVFAARPRTQARVALLLTDDLSIRLLSRRYELPLIAPDRGGLVLMKALQEAIAADPRQSISHSRAQLAAYMVGEGEESWSTWWQSRLIAAAGSAEEATWLTLGAPMRSGNRISAAAVRTLELDTPGAADAALVGSVSVPNGSVQARRLLEFVLKGHCSDASPFDAMGEAAELILMWAPYNFYREARAVAPNRSGSGRLHSYGEMSAGLRRQIAKRLIARDVRYARVDGAAKLDGKEKKTTSVWSDAARELTAIHGPSLLAAEITIIGAALPLELAKTDGDLTEDSEPFGAEVDYGQLLREVRRNRSDHLWWTSMFERYFDDLSRATWVLSLLAVADTAVIVECLDLVDEVTRTLPESDLRAVRFASSRLGSAGHARRLDRSVLERLDRCASATALLVLHHTVAVDESNSLSGFSSEFLGAMINFEIYSWPAAQAINFRMLSEPSLECLELLRAAGPQWYLNCDPQNGLPGGVVRDVLVKPAELSSDWVSVSEQLYSGKIRHSSLADLADGEGWFSTP